MSTVYLFCFIAAVAANPVFQRIQLSPPSPSQTCPSSFPAACPTCPTGCPAQTCSPQVLPAPCQNCQNSLQDNPLQNNPLQNNQLQNILSTIPVVVRPSNNCPCNNCAPAQNQVVNQPLSQEALGQLVLSQILGPQIQQLLTPNGKSCSQCETQKTGAVPNIINNYIIIPPEYYTVNETNAKNAAKVVQGTDAKGGRKRKVNRQTPKSEKVQMLYDLLLEFLKTHYDDDNSDNNGRRKQSGKRGKPRKQEPTGCSCEEKEESTIYPRDEKRKEYIEINGEKIKQTKNLQQNKQLTDQNQLKLINTRNPEYLKSLEEAIVKDFCTKNPTIPEEIARSLLANVIRQIKNQEISYNHHSSYSPIAQYPEPNTKLHNNGQQINQIPPERERTHNGRRHPKKNKSDRQSQQKNFTTQSNKDCENCNKTVELNPNVVNIEKEIITTEKIMTTTEKSVPKPVSESQIESKKDLVDKLEVIKDKYAKLNEVETTTASYNKLVESFPELGNEDKVPTFYENGVDVDDFYPDFRGDVPFYESGEELNRYHYTTDRNGMAEGKRYVNHKKHKSLLSDTNSEYTLPVPVEEDSLEESKDIKNDEVQFRTPPVLELPDFKTKQINKYYNSEEINDFVPDDSEKASVYSNSKTNFRVLENDLRPVKVFSKDKKGRTSVETVLGHSKVVRYGQDNTDIQDAASTPAITYYLPEEAMTQDRIQLPDGDGIVVAKSIRDLEQIWV